MRASSQTGCIRRGCAPPSKAQSFVSRRVFDREIAMLERVPPQFRELQEITMQTDTRDILAHATRQSESHEDYFLVDIDAHVTETSFWPEILALIDNDVIRQMGEANSARPGNAGHALLNLQPGMLHQDLYGRIPHQQALLEPVEKTGVRGTVTSSTSAPGSPRQYASAATEDQGCRIERRGNHRHSRCAGRS